MSDRGQHGDDKVTTEELLRTIENVQATTGSKDMGKLAKRVEEFDARCSAGLPPRKK